MESSSTNSIDPSNSHGNVGNNPPDNTNTTNDNDKNITTDEKLTKKIFNQKQNDSESNSTIFSSVDQTKIDTTNNSTQSITNPTEPLSTNNKNDQDDQNINIDSSNENNYLENNNKQQHTDSTLNKQQEEQRNVHLQNQNNIIDQNTDTNSVDNSMDIEKNNQNQEQSIPPSLNHDLELGAFSHPTALSDQILITSENKDINNHLPNDGDNIQEPLHSEVQHVDMETSDDEISISTNYKKFKFEDLLNSFRSDKPWLNCQYHDINQNQIKKPNEIEEQMDEPSDDTIDKNILNRIQGSIIGMAIGDALGAHVEFRPYEYLVQHPVEDLGSGGTWGLEKGQFTDDTSMALCLANSLIAWRGFNPYDQLVRYKWWYKYGYMSSTGHCFDIGAATRQSIVEFEHRQNQFRKKINTNVGDMDFLSDIEMLKKVNIYCSEDGVAGNGALMRLAPVPLFFYKDPVKAVEYSGISGEITHGDKKAYDACRYYGALIVAALHGYTKEKLLDEKFYSEHKTWFGKEPLHDDIKKIAEGSYKKPNGYKDGIRGKGYIVNALEAALWAFWANEDSFEKGALKAVNLGDDTDTTAAIYGQLAGAYYGYENLPTHWLQHVYARTFMEKLSKWIAYEGERWQNQPESSSSQS